MKQPGHIVLLYLDAVVVAGKSRGELVFGHALTVDLRLVDAVGGQSEGCAFQFVPDGKSPPEYWHQPGFIAVQRVAYPFCSINHLAEQKITKNLPACPVETTLTLIGDKWKVLILRDLMLGTKRFGELKKSIGHVSQKVLTAQLRDMEESGLLSRKVYAEVPPRVEYTLTELGYSLKPVLDALWNWGEEYKAKQ